jgi:hypothetical protein
MLGLADSVGDFERGFAGKDRCAGISRANGGVPINLVALEALRDLLGAGFDFLEAEDIGFLTLEVVHEALA